MYTFFANFLHFHTLNCWPLKMLGPIGPRASRERVKLKLCLVAGRAGT
jgi:hypothetical protein